MRASIPSAPLLAAPVLAALALLPTTALAQAGTDVSALIAADGLSAAASALAALPEPTPSERFALGGVLFLRGVERALQLRYEVGLGGGLPEMSMLPILRLPVPENPSPAPFEPAMIEALFAGVEADMAGALEALGTVADDDEVAVTIALADLWFDVDGSGARDPGEGVAEVAGLLLAPDPFATAFDEFGNPVEEPPLAPAGPVIRFDTADAAWLAAYAHLLSGVSEAVLAVGPTDGIARVLDARAAFADVGVPPLDPYAYGPPAADYVDLAAMVVFALDGVPDPKRTRAVRDHLLACIEQNRRFWTLVAQEGDDEAEWIPSKRQASATGLPFPPETGPTWLRVLDDAEAVLTGDLLIPFWRVAPTAGLDLGALLEDPPDLNVAGLVQGGALAPYLRTGKLASAESLWRFSALVGGNAPLYAVMIN